MPNSPALEIQILQPSHKELVSTFAKQRLAALHPDPNERELKSWTARWRGESLDHYLRLGWSFGALSSGEMHGFILGQPLLFFRGLTQTLWIEHLEASGPEPARILLETAYRWARDKHFQCLFSESSATLTQALENWPGPYGSGGGGSTGGGDGDVRGQSFVEIKSARF